MYRIGEMVILQQLSMFDDMNEFKKRKNGLRKYDLYKKISMFNLRPFVELRYKAVQRHSKAHLGTCYQQSITDQPKVV